MRPELTKVQIAAEFVLQDGEFKTPGTFGPVEMTAREWASFDLQAAIDAGVADAPDAVTDELVKAAPNRAARRRKPAKHLKGGTR